MGAEKSKMRLTREMLERLTDRSTDIVVATDRKGRGVYYNDGIQYTPLRKGTRLVCI